MTITCEECGSEIEDVHDTTYSNINTSRCNAGDHTGNIYKCDECGSMYIDNFLNGKVELWSY